MLRCTRDAQHFAVLSTRKCFGGDGQQWDVTYLKSVQCYDSSSLALVLDLNMGGCTDEVLATVDLLGNDVVWHEIESDHVVALPKVIEVHAVWCLKYYFFIDTLIHGVDFCCES